VKLYGVLGSAGLTDVPLYGKDGPSSDDIVILRAISLIRGLLQYLVSIQTAASMCDNSLLSVSFIPSNQNCIMQLRRALLGGATVTPPTSKMSRELTQWLQ